MDEKEVNPIQNRESLGEKVSRIAKIIFRKPIPEEYFTKPYQVANDSFETETWDKCCEAIAKFGMSFSEANSALIKLNNALPKINEINLDNKGDN